MRGSHRTREEADHAVKRPCLVCAVLVENASWCPAHNPNSHRRRVTPGRTTKQQSRFRQQVLAAAGYRCQAIENGARCAETRHLEAHHIAKLRTTASFDPAAGVCLCARHHHLIERHAA
jgi:predicted restriction endonuclease